MSRHLIFSIINKLKRKGARQAVQSGGIFHTCKGFTLMETLVSTMILGVALVTIMQLFSGGLRSAQISEDYTRAVFLLRAKLDEILLTTPLVETVLEGSDNGHNWECRITPEEDLGQIPENDTVSLVLMDISCTVHWLSGNNEKEYTLKTVRSVEPASLNLDST